MPMRKVSQRSVARILKAGKPLAGLFVGLSSTLGAAERELSGLAIRGEPGPIVTAAKTGCTNGASNVATKMRSTNSVEEGHFEVTAGLIPMTDELRAEREKMRAEAFGVSFLRKFRVFPKPPVFDDPSTLIRSTQVWPSDFPMSPSEFAASLKAGKGYAGGYVPMRKGPCGAVFYVFVHNLNRRQSLGELVKGSPHFESLEALELFEKIYVQSGMRCWRMEPGNFDPDPQGVYFYADENP